MLDVTIKNIDNKQDDVFTQNICELALYVGESPDRPVGLSADYFSEPNKTVQEYYHYKLPIGENKDIKLGWLINFNDNTIDHSKIRLIVGFGSAREDYKYVNLDL